MNTKTEVQSVALNEKDSASYISMSASFLRQGRMNGAREGRTPPPPHLKIGRSVRYLRADLDKWLRQFRQGEVSEVRGCS